jgi:hypothetical protein
MPVITKVPVPIAKVPEANTRMRKFTTSHSRAPVRRSPGPLGLGLRRGGWRSLRCVVLLGNAFTIGATNTQCAACVASGP